MDGRHLEAITEDQIEWRHEVDAELVLELAEALREAVGLLRRADGVMGNRRCHCDLCVDRREFLARFEREEK